MNIFKLKNLLFITVIIICIIFGILESLIIFITIPIWMPIYFIITGNTYNDLDFCWKYTSKLIDWCELKIN